MNRTAEATANLVRLAEKFDAARIAANAIPDTAWQMHAYGDASNGLLKVLELLTGSPVGAELAMQAIHDCCSVQQALGYAKEQMDYAAADAEEADAPDHIFRIVNGRSGQVVLETASYYEAASCQYENNCAETAVGYEPVFGMWLVDNDGIAVRINTQQ